MKMLRAFSIALVAAAIAWSAAADVKHAEKSANPGWEKMKFLVGEWEGTVAHGDATMPVTISYTLVSSGNSLMERLTTPDGADMVTMYHRDGARIMMTHYCASGNQPRMRAEVPSGDVASLAFSFVDATNLVSPAEEHMRNLVVRFDDADHFRQEWTHRKAGKEETGLFKYTRKK
jgi:hypothetical protein